MAGLSVVSILLITLLNAASASKRETGYPSGNTFSAMKAGLPKLTCIGVCLLVLGLEIIPLCICRALSISDTLHLPSVSRFYLTSHSLQLLSDPPGLQADLFWILYWIIALIIFVPGWSYISRFLRLKKVFSRKGFHILGVIMIYPALRGIGTFSGDVPFVCVCALGATFLFLLAGGLQRYSPKMERYLLEFSDE